MALFSSARQGMSPNLMARLLRQIGLPGRNRCRSCHNSGFPSGLSADVSFVFPGARYLFFALPFGLLSLISPDDLLTGAEFQKVVGTKSANLPRGFASASQNISNNFRSTISK
jgi:hypothetical protein